VLWLHPSGEVSKSDKWVSDKVLTGLQVFLLNSHKLVAFVFWLGLTLSLHGWQSPAVPVPETFLPFSAAGPSSAELVTGHQHKQEHLSTADGQVRGFHFLRGKWTDKAMTTTCRRAATVHTAFWPHGYPGRAGKAAKESREGLWLSTWFLTHLPLPTSSCPPDLQSSKHHCDM
jgi:hypothetical protein